MWNNKFKIALAQKDTNTLEKLLSNIPEFSDEKEIKDAQYLLKEAISLLQTLKEETAISMKQIKLNLDFLASTNNKAPSKLDIKS